MFFLFLTFSLFSCDQSAILNEFETIDGGSWRYDQPIHEEVTIEDTSKMYQLSVNIRHDVHYEWANLYCLLHLKHPDGKQYTQRLNLVLAEPDGKWLGKGIGSIKEARIPVATVKFPKKGIYTLTLEQNMRLNPLKGIEDIGWYLGEEQPVSIDTTKVE